MISITNVLTRWAGCRGREKKDWITDQREQGHLAFFTPYPIQGVPPIDSNYPVNELAREEGHCVDVRKAASQSVSCPGLR